MRVAAQGQLRVTQPESIPTMLVGVLGRALAVPLPFEPFELTLRGLPLPDIDLRGIDLRGADLTGTDLRKVRLEGAKLFGVLGHELDLSEARLEGERTELGQVDFRNAQARSARFDGANLIKAHLEGAQLSQASFRGGRLPSAHLDGAMLVGAQFAGADLNDTYFRGAILDQEALLGIVKAKRWWRAHFDPEARQALERMRASR